MTSAASRREFLRQASAMAAAGIVSPFAVGLTGMTAASAQTASDYKALICLNMAGGNDHLTSFVPYDQASYTRYAAVRGGLALPRNTLLPIVAPSDQGGRAIGFGPVLGGVKSLYDTGRAAVISSVGPLVAPTTRADIVAGRATLPKLLGSHSDQSNLWATLEDSTRLGWGGRLADLMAASNTKPIYTSISASGYSLFTVGAQTSSFNVSEAGAPSVFFGQGATLREAVIGQAQRTNLLESAYVQINQRLADGAGDLSRAILPEGNFPGAPGGGQNLLAQQLLTVARIIGANQALGVGRQIFFVDIGGFDTHLGQSWRHDALMRQVNDAIVYFDALIGQVGLRNTVTLFTTSEFGRTFVPNGDGTDHGWGSHHLVVGGAVKGGTIYGQLPIIDTAGPDFVPGGGQMIPSTSASQYAATLGRWMGASDAALAAIFPNLDRFGQSDLHFL